MWNPEITKAGSHWTEGWQSRLISGRPRVPAQANSIAKGISKNGPETVRRICRHSQALKQVNTVRDDAGEQHHFISTPIKCCPIICPICPGGASCGNACPQGHRRRTCARAATGKIPKAAAVMMSNPGNTTAAGKPLACLAQDLRQKALRP